MKRTVTSYASAPRRPAAQLLIGQVYERQNRLDDAQAAYVELRSHYGTSPAAADATYLLAELVLRGQAATTAMPRPARSMARWPTSSRRAAGRRRRWPGRRRSRTRPSCGWSTPTCRHRSRRRSSPTGRWCGAYPSSPQAETAFEELAERYKDVRQFALAAEALEQLATRFPTNRRDAAWRAGELYEDKVKDPARARAAYALVPATSPRYRDAQKKLR